MFTGRRRDTDIVTTVVENLSPWNTYQCRVKAVNVLGESPASVPSASFFTLMAKPIVPPKNVSGGGGKIGDLKITWEVASYNYFAIHKMLLILE